MAPAKDGAAWKPSVRNTWPDASREIASFPRGSPSQHYRRIKERPFAAEERSKTTMLMGDLTALHDALLRAVFTQNGFRVESLPEPTKKSFRVGKEHCNSGLCNPVYYTAGALIERLRALEAEGLSRPHIIDNYVYLTISDCGPCRLGTYESEYRQALQNAGFAGFRVVTFQANKASRTGGDAPGLDMSLDHWLGIANALILGDLLYSVTYRLRPYEVNPGETERAIEECVGRLAEYFRSYPHFELEEALPGWLHRRLTQHRGLSRLLSIIGKYGMHYYRRDYLAVLEACRERLARVQVDRTRPRPVVKIVGELYSHLVETDANYKMFAFLESEGAEVAVSSIVATFDYLLFKSRGTHLERRGLGPGESDVRPWQLRRRFKNAVAFYTKPALLWLIARLLHHQYRRMNRLLGRLGASLVTQEELAKAGGRYYRPLTRGGEGFLEVARSIHSTTQGHCHMVLSLKPFGCMPSTQSDGVMATVSSHYEKMLFASIETTGDSDINAYSRVQMVLSDAHRQAMAEFEQVLCSTGKSLEAIRDYQQSRPELRYAACVIPRHPGIAGSAANNVITMSEMMDREKYPWRRWSCLAPRYRRGSLSAWTLDPRRSKR